MIRSGGGFRRLCMAMVALAGVGMVGAQTASSGPLKVEVVTAYNFVVDSNVESPSTNGPSAAHLAVKVTNTGAVPMTNVVVNMGDLLDTGTWTGTPGVFPSRTVSVSGSGAYSGTFALVMPGGAVDAARTIATIAPGKSVLQYFFVTYPLKDSLGRAVTGQAPVVTDDLWLNYDAWASGVSGGTTYRTNVTAKVTMRNEISAMANKVYPNTTAKVPNEYLDAIEAALGWRPSSESPRIPGAMVTEGIWYDFGNIGAGFDNNGDLIPDRNAWMQPVGDPAQFNPLSFRMVKCYGLVVVKLNDGTERLYPFEDQLYFENMPGNNTGAVGIVYYEFMPLVTGATSSTSPYQEVASGYDNEKFNGDYGSGGSYLTAPAPSLTLDKTGPSTVAVGDTVTYGITATNTGLTTIGDPNLGIPFVIEDSVPAGVNYRLGSAVDRTGLPALPAGYTLSVSYYVGTSWTTTEPALGSQVTRVRWTLENIGFEAAKSIAVQFRVGVPAGYTSRTLSNTAVARLNGTGSLATDTTVATLTGPNLIGDYVWYDANRDGLQTGETGIPNIDVSLYFDANGSGTIDSGESVFATTTTNGSGAYTFPNLPDGNYIVVVNSADAQLPVGYVLPLSASATRVVALDPLNASGNTAVEVRTADWPFIEALVLNKRTDPVTYEEGDLVTYYIDVENWSSPVPTFQPTVQSSYAATVTDVRAGQLGTNAQGTNDANFARLDYEAAADRLTANQAQTANAWTFTDPTGTITGVELVVRGYMQSRAGAPLTTATFNDTMEVHLDNADSGGATPDVTITAAQLIAMQGPAKDLVIPITNLNNGGVFATWADLRDTKVQLRAAKVSAGDRATFWIDSIALRVTRTLPAPAGGIFGPNSFDPVPLEDTFDPTKLQYVTAVPLPSSVTSGRLIWNDVGPVNPGTRQTVSVTFRTLAPTGASEVFVNSVTTDGPNTAGAFYPNGRPTNVGSDTQNITVLQRARIGDFVYWDRNSNGVFDGTDTPIRDALVYLDNGAQAYTDVNGYYLFTGLGAGAYVVTVDPATLPFTTYVNTDDPSTPGTGPDTGDLTNTVTVTTVSGVLTSFLNQDFGFSSSQNAVSGTIYMDRDGDGTRDAGEEAISGQTVELYNVTSGALITTTTTDANGFYQFPGLGSTFNYSVRTTAPSGTVQTFEQDGTLNGNTTVATTGVTGTMFANRDFAYRPSGLLAIGDTVYQDVDADGIQDGGEPGMSGITVRLYEDANGDGFVDVSTDALIATQDTNSVGFYQFTGLVAGNYTVVVDTADLPAGAVQTQDYDGSLDHIGVVTNLTASLATVDFGYVTRGTGSIGDKVFVDTDSDGVHDASEAGIPNITVVLYYDADGDMVLDPTDILVATTSSDASGNYLFTGLPPARYLVDVTQTDPDLPAGYLSTEAEPLAVNLATGQAYVLADFGFAPAGAIGDTVFYDLNANGTQDWNEGGIGGVTVRLYFDANGNGLVDGGDSLSGTATTNTSDVTKPVGFYNFTGLPEGEYIVVVDSASVPLTGLVQTADPDRDGVPVGDNSYPLLPAADHTDSNIVLTPGLSYTGADFGYKPAVVIGDTVWFDFDRDGIQDAGEAGIPGVTLTISGSSTYNVTTDPEGLWNIGGIADGAWTVTVDASNFSPGGALAGRVVSFDPNGGTASPANSAAFTITGGAVVSLSGNADADADGWNDEIDFGYTLSGTSYSLSGTVVTNDGGVSGTADVPATEIEIAGVTVYLYSATGTLLATAETDAAGNYSFSGLITGTYDVVIGKSVPALSGATLTTTVANNAAVSAVVNTAFTVKQTVAVASASVSDVDFAFAAQPYDYGDLPAVYGMTGLVEDGARHLAPSGGFTAYLGSVPDVETDGAASVYAVGDGADEDGVTFNANGWSDGADGLTNVLPGSGSLSVNVAGGGWLVVWVDWNNDGDFLDSGDAVISRAVSAGSGQSISFAIPANAITGGAQSWYTRVRLFASEPAFATAAYGGEAVNGEVEDYYISRGTGTISGRVLADLDNNGSGDIGIAGVQVALWSDPNGDGNPADGAVVGVPPTTIVDGSYVFEYVPAGNYVVVETQPAGYLTVTDVDSTPDSDTAPNSSGTDNRIPVTVASGETDNGNDFIEMEAATVGDYVWFDLNGNGAQDSGELPIAGVVVFIDSNTSGSRDPGEPFATTDGAGAYLITGLAPGSYTVAVQVSTLPYGALTVQSGDPDGVLNNKTTVVLGVGQDVTTADFGYRGNGSIGDYVWNDADGDGNQDSAELPMSGVRVYLDLDNDNVRDASEPNATTNSSGLYTIGGLPAGTYTVRVDTTTLPAGATQTGDPDAAIDHETVVVLASGDNHVTADFGYQGTLSIGDFVWNDRDGDGVQDGGAELGISSLNVFIDTDNNGVRDPEDPYAETNASGAYLISGLFPGTYKVMLDPLTVPAGTMVTGDPDAVMDGVTVVVLTTSTAAVDFGLKGNGVIGGHLWGDRDADGITDGDELFFAGVKVFIDVDGDGVYEPGMGDQETTTNAEGEYSFSGLPAGTYTVSVNTATLPAGLSQTYDKDLVLNHRTTVTIAAGDIVTDLDFGYRGSAQIGDTVWNDRNGDGVQDAGEPPIAGVRVYIDVDGDQMWDVGEPSEITNAAGQYLFANLVYGTYTVAVDPSDYPEGATVTGDPDATKDARTVVTVTALAPTVLTADFGFQGTSSLGDYVWYDVNGDGVQDAGEPALSGVTVYLDLDNNGSAGAGEPTAVTSGAGAYSFTGLIPLTYQVRTVAPSGMTPTYDLDGTGTANLASVVLAEASNRTDVDFGYRGTATITGHLYYDTNDSADQEIGEPDLANVDVIITDASGVVFRVTSGSNGDWTAVVTPGSVTADVDEADPQYPTGYTQTEGDDPTTVTAIALQTVSAGNDGYYSPGTISGRVMIDRDNNGTGDEGLGGVTIKLYADADADGVPDDMFSPTAVATTAISGLVGGYSFTDVVPGNYVVVETQPSGYRTVTDVDASSDTDAVSNVSTVDNLIPVTIAAAETDADNNFIEQTNCPTTWAEWQSRNPLGGQNGATVNPDGDRWSNVQEFVYCFNPSSGVYECPLALVFNGNGTIDATVRQVPGVQGVTYRLEYIADLNNSGVEGAGWTDSGLTPVLTTNPDGSVKATYVNLETIPALAGGTGFVRSVVALDLNGDLDTNDAGETVRSYVEGWMDQTFQVNCESCSLPFESCPVLVGRIGTVAGNGFDATAGLGGVQLSTLLDLNKCYYVDVLSGSYEGHRFEIDTASSRGTSVTIVPGSWRNTMALLPGLAGLQYAIREYKTIGSQFPVASYGKGSSLATADYILTYQDGQWKTYYVLDVNGTGRWVEAGSTDDRSGVCLDPSAPLFVHRKVTTLAQTQAGTVRQTKFALPLPAGCRMAPNPWPVAASVVDRGLVNPSNAASDPFVGATSSGAADQVMFWGGDTTLGSLTQEVHYYLKTTTRNHYTRAGNSSLPNTGIELLFKPLRSQYYCPKTAHVDYVMPLPWVP